MKIYRHIDDPKLQLDRSVVTLGNFDGLHIGHRWLVRSAVDDAHRSGIPSVVLTFEPHPLRVLAPARAPKLILSHKDKMELLQSFGIDIVVVQTFDASFASLEAETFVRKFLKNRLHAEKVWVGSDFRFGRGRQGTFEHLKLWSSEMGFAVGVVEPILIDGARVSSSRIRQLLAEGRVDQAQRMLGRFHFVSGKVVPGNRRGRLLGFPTANITTRTEVIPLDGIYATLIRIGPELRLSVSSIGLNPTFGAGPRTIESFILDYDREIYGKAVKLFFVRRIRDEKKFSVIDQLAAQIAEDVKAARAIFDDLDLRHEPGAAK